MVLLTGGTVAFDSFATSCFSKVLSLLSVQRSYLGKHCLCGIALFLDWSNSVKMEATNQLCESEDEIIISPNTVASIAPELENCLPTKAIISREDRQTTNVSVWVFLKEYPGQHFAVVRGKLRCNACRENLSDKKNAIERNTKSKKIFLAQSRRAY